MKLTPKTKVYYLDYLEYKGTSQICDVGLLEDVMVEESFGHYTSIHTIIEEIKDKYEKQLKELAADRDSLRTALLEIKKTKQNGTHISKTIQ